MIKKIQGNIKIVILGTLLEPFSHLIHDLYMLQTHIREDWGWLESIPGREVVEGLGLFLAVRVSIVLVHFITFSDKFW